MHVNAQTNNFPDAYKVLTEWVVEAAQEGKKVCELILNHEPTARKVAESWGETGAPVALISRADKVVIYVHLDLYINPTTTAAVFGFAAEEVPLYLSAAWRAGITLPTAQIFAHPCTVSAPHQPCPQAHVVILEKIRAEIIAATQAKQPISQHTCDTDRLVALHVAQRLADEGYPLALTFGVNERQYFLYVVLGDVARLHAAFPSSEQADYISEGWQMLIGTEQATLHHLPLPIAKKLRQTQKSLAHKPWRRPRQHAPARPQLPAGLLGPLKTFVRRER